MTDFEFPCEIKPRQNLWPGIEQAINNTQPQATTSSVWPRASLAAAATLLLAVAVVLLNNKQVAVPAFDPGEAFASYEQEKQQMLVAYSQQPALTDNWQQQLNELETAAQSIRDALKHDPNNTVLIHMLNNVYQQQLKLIKKVHTPRWQNI
jgi:hypothetical protein